MDGERGGDYMNKRPFVCEPFPLAFMLRLLSKMRSPHWRVFSCIRCRKKVWSIGVLSPLGDKNFACGQLTTLVGKKNDIRFRWSLFLIFFSLACILVFWHCGLGNNEFTFMALSCYESCMSPSPSNLLSRPHEC